MVEVTLEMFAATVLIILALHPSAASIPTPSPPSAFIASPQNTSVIEGHPAILKCKTRESIYSCQWSYKEKGMDFYDDRFYPKPIKVFTAKDNDCSIKFTKVNMRQMGQWQCNGFNIIASRYIVSEPVTLNVIPKNKPNDPPSQTEAISTEIDYTMPDDSTLSTPKLFPTMSNSHLINSHLGYEVFLECQTTVPLKECSWITPEGIKYKREGPKPLSHSHINIVGEMKEGNCSLRTIVKYQDEGNWRCIVKPEGETGQRVGPLIHLHIIELGPHDSDEESTKQPTGASLISILASTLIILLFIVVALCLYIYRQKWSKGPLRSQFISANGANVDYNTYDRTWLPTFGIKEQQLLNDQKLRDEDDTSSNHYARYLDMTGTPAPGREGYVMFPASSIRSSTSSRTTLSTLPAGRHSSVGNNSGHTSISESLPSMSSVDEFPFDKKGLGRTPSTYSTGHLYEEIKYAQKEDFERQKPFPKEDKSGYIIPNPPTQIHIIQKTQQTPEKNQVECKAPPYSKVGESGLVPAGHSTNWASNPTYGLESANKDSKQSAKEDQGSYDIPANPPLPIRTDSADDNPLAKYDVPSKIPTPVQSGEEDNVSNA